MLAEPQLELETCGDCNGAQCFISGDGFAVYGDLCECVYSRHPGRQVRRDIPRALDLRAAYLEGMN